MSPCPPTISFASRLALVLGLLSFFCGCALPQPAPPPRSATHRPQNVFAGGAVLLQNVRRVAWLPMACDPASAEMIEGRDALDPIVRDELAKTHRFEVIPIGCEALQARTGRPTWSCEDTLPRDLFPWLVESRGCDAVLFCRLTVFHGYAPLAVGWRMRLVDLRTGATLWATDEIFDTERPEVQTWSRPNQLARLLGWPRVPDDWVVQNSPRQFGQNAAARLVATLPGS